MSASQCRGGGFPPPTWWRLPWLYASEFYFSSSLTHYFMLARLVASWVSILSVLACKAFLAFSRRGTKGGVRGRAPGLKVDLHRPAST